MGNTESQAAIATFNGQGGLEGFVKFESHNEDGYKSLVTIDLKGFRSDAMHAIHVHEYGDVSGGCHTAGGHYNPHNVNHGSYLRAGQRHAGDMINNIQPYPSQGDDEFYCVSMQYFDSAITPAEVIGRTVMIHDLSDDLGSKGSVEYNVSPDGRLLSRREINITPYARCGKKHIKEMARQRRYQTQYLQKLKAQSEITGNAGGRMACAVIGIANPELKGKSVVGIRIAEIAALRKPLETKDVEVKIQKRHKC
jgi:Cu-Zn family superoxide dismutase